MKKLSKKLKIVYQLLVIFKFLIQEYNILQEVKMESIRKLSNQWTKTLYQNNLNFIAFFFTLFKSYRRN